MTRFTALQASQQLVCIALRVRPKAQRVVGTAVIARNAIALSLLVLTVTDAAALDCPTPPQQTQKDWQVTVDAEVAKIGPVKGGELKSRTQVATQDLLGKLPDAGRIYLEQMMFAAYCTAIRDDKSLPDSEKALRLQQYSSEVRKTLGKATVTPSETSPPKRGSDARIPSKDAIAWKMAWLDISEMMDTIPTMGLSHNDITRDGYQRRYTDRQWVLNALNRIDLSFDKSLNTARANLVEKLKQQPKADTLYTQLFPNPNMDVVVFSGWLHEELRKLRSEIRDGAMAHGVEVQARGAAN